MHFSDGSFLGQQFNIQVGSTLLGHFYQILVSNVCPRFFLVDRIVRYIITTYLLVPKHKKKSGTQLDPANINTRYGLRLSIHLQSEKLLFR